MGWDLHYLTRSGDEDMGAAAESVDDTVTTTKGATAFWREESEMTITAGDFVAGDEVLFSILRDGTNEGASGMASPAAVYGIYFEYTDV